MDISKLSIDEVMQMPDHLFGRRFVVSCTCTATAPGRVYDISETALPDRAVMWEFAIHHHIWSPYGTYIRLSLGDHLPANFREFDALEPLFPNFGEWITPGRYILGSSYCEHHHNRLRTPITAQGRRLVMETTLGITGEARMTASLVVSAIPKTIPNWLVPPNKFDVRSIYDLIDERNE